jgi:putative transposase
MGARGYFVSTVEEMIRTYIKNQEMADKQLDQLQLKLAPLVQMITIL